MHDIQTVERKLFAQYQVKGILLEDEIINICIDEDLDLTEIDRVCGRLISKGVIIGNKEFNKVSSSDNIIDKSQIDYGILQENIATEYPSMKTLIEYTSQILPPQTKEWRSLIVPAQQGNIYARERIVLMYLRTVLKQAYNFAKLYSCDLEEVFQWGVIGLITAIDKYDVSSSDTFVSYFPLWVRQTMQREASFNNVLFYFPAHFKEKLFPVMECIQAYDCGENDIVMDEIRCSIVSNEEELKKILLCLSPPIELKEETAEIDVWEEYIRSHCCSTVINKLFAQLKERELDIIMTRYGFIDGEEKTLEEVGAKFRVTRERIRQIELKAIKKMQVYIQNNHINLEDLLL